MSQFVDECGLNVRGGDGGAGAVSFRREAMVPFGGPDGGNGGGGGHVWLVADRNVASLLAFRDHPHRRATSGVHGRGKRQHGHAGEDLMVAVPEGTVIKDQDGALLADLVNHGDRWIAAHGGRGGKGNAAFLSNRRRAPSFGEQGEEGEERWLHLELKLAADVALVGYPNVGKSTLISRISAAKPKIADYPFTTLEPNLGVVRMDDGFELVVADIPGLIEGAHEGKGLGHRFLRHIERARALVVMVDLAMAEETSPEEQERILLHELASYDPELARRPRLVIGSRADLEGVIGAPHPEFTGRRVSAITGQGLPQLVGDLVRMVDEARKAEPVSEAFVVHRPETEGFQIVKADDGAWEVQGRAAMRAVALSDMTNIEALDYARQRLQRLGVNKALRQAGAQTGDSVRIGRIELDYAEDD